MEQVPTYYVEDVRHIEMILRHQLPSMQQEAICMAGFPARMTYIRSLYTVKVLSAVTTNHLELSLLLQLINQTHHKFGGLHQTSVREVKFNTRIAINIGYRLIGIRTCALLV